MWAVGRLSLLSRGPGLGKADPGATPVVARGNNPKSVFVSVHEPAPAPVPPPVPVPAPVPEPAPLGVVQRVFMRVKSFFRSIFG